MRRQIGIGHGLAAAAASVLVATGLFTPAGLGMAAIQPSHGGPVPHIKKPRQSAIASGRICMYPRSKNPRATKPVRKGNRLLMSKRTRNRHRRKAA